MSTPAATVVPQGQEPTTRAVIAALVAFVFVWGATLAIGNAPFPILHDMSEAYVWGREFQFGYNQHPPFWAWVCGAWFLVFPRTGWAFALLGALNAGIGLGGAWMLIGRFARGPKRVAALALLLLTPFYTFGCYKYDANTIFLSIWPWTIYFFWASLEERRLGAAIGFGLCAGLALMSKYYALILFATCGLAALQTPYFWGYLRARSPWISVAFAAAVCAPHVVWLLTHQAPPLQYLASVSGRRFVDIAGDAASTGLTSLVSLLAALAVAIWFSRGPKLAPAESPHLRVLGTLAFAPLILTLIAGLALRTKLTPEMPIGTFALAPLFFIEVLGAPRPERLAALATRLAAGLLALMFVASPFVMAGRVWLWAKANEVAPMAEIAVEANKLWREKVGTPLAFVAGHGYENGVVFYSPDRARSFYDFNFSRSLWVTPEALAKYGLLTVCLKDDAECLAQNAKFLTPQTTQTNVTVAHRFWTHVTRDFNFVVTIVPPRG